MNIDHLTYQELINLNRKIVERLKLMDHIRTHSEMMEFSVGDKVSFTNRGRRITGMLVKYNRKTVTIVTDDGEKWNVSPDFLSKADAKATDEPDNIIDIKEDQTA